MPLNAIFLWIFCSYNRRYQKGDFELCPQGTQTTLGGCIPSLQLLGRPGGKTQETQCVEGGESGDLRR